MNPMVKPVALARPHQELVELLRQTSLFRGLSPTLLEKVADIAVQERAQKDAVIYRVDDSAKDLYVLVAGRISHAHGPAAQARVLVKAMERGEVFGWAALLKEPARRFATVTVLADSELLRIRAADLMRVLADDHSAAHDVLARCAKMIIEDFTVPAWLAQVQDVPIGKGPAVRRQAAAGEIGAWAMLTYRLSKWAKSPTPYLMLLGFVLFFGAWYLLSEVFKVWRFASLPGPKAVLVEWFSPQPTYGMSLYTPDYYMHVWMSMRRVLYAFVISTSLGVPFGLFLGWSKNFRDFTFPVFETLRPIPVLAWVPLAIVMFRGDESPVIFLTTLASFYATALNTMLGVQSIEESYTRAAACLGASKWQIFRHVIIPGALPFIFTGLQISVGVAWFSLVAAEMVSGEYGLGYLINSSYVNVQYPIIIIGMISVGIVGYVSSALVRLAGDYMMQWRVRELALGGSR